MERRLLHYTAKDLGVTDPTKYNGRLSQANADAQQTQRVDKLNNTQYAYYGNDVKTNVAPSQLGGENTWSPTQQGTTTGYQVTPNVDPSSAALLTEGKAVYGAQPGQQTVYQNTPGKIGQTVNIPQGEIALNAFNRLVQSGLTEEQAATRLNDPQYKMDIRTATNAAGPAGVDITGKIPGYSDTSSRQWTPATGMTRSEYEQQTTELQRRNTELLKQQQIKNEEKQKEKPKAPTIDFGETKKKIDELDTILGQLNPEVKSAVGLEIMTLRNQMDSVEKQANDLISTLPSDKQIEGQYQPQTDFALKMDDQMKALADKNLETLKQVAEYNRDMLEVDKKIMEQKAHEDESKQIQTNIQNERKIRRQLNALGIQTDVQGLDYLNTAIQEGQDALASLRTANSLNSLKANLAIGEGYRLDVQKALDAHEGAYLQISNQTYDKITSINNSIAQAKSEKQKEIRDTLKWAAEKKNALELETAKTITNANYKMMDEQNRIRDDQRAQEQLGWQRLENVIKTYGSFAPQSLLDSIAKQLPGVDVASVAKQMTLAEMKQFKIKNGGGGGGGAGLSFAGIASDPTGVASQFDTMSPQEVRSAIDRAMLKFGGTGGERNRKRNEYMDRVARGEPVGTIISDLITDYWASRPSPEHDQRRNAAGDMETILSYAQSYGITEDDDGPLGKFDSNLQWLGSFAGLSSDAYNDLSSIVGNVKGRITRANAGTAVSPWELTQIKEYAPSMELKGPKFFSNVRNYKAMVEYLDAKEAASKLGLPLPKPPVPVTQSGTAAAGPGKYSADDITSALLN